MGLVYLLQACKDCSIWTTGRPMGLSEPLRFSRGFAVRAPSPAPPCTLCSGFIAALTMQALFYAEVS